jgi:C-terminal processing protease CtpA/Prc
MKSALLALPLLAHLAVPAAAHAQQRFVWEHDPASTMLTGIDATGGMAGSGALRIELANWPEPSTMTLRARVVDGRLRGREVEVTAHLRTAALEGEGAMVFGTYRGRVVGQSAAVFGPDWTRVSLTFELPADSGALFVTVMPRAPGTVWVDDVVVTLRESGDTLVHSRFESTTEIAPIARTLRMSPEEPPRPLTARGRDNLVALARAVQVIRFFHPSDGVAAANWDEVVVNAVRRVEGAADGGELAAAFRTVFADVAPDAVFHRTGERPPVRSTSAGDSTGFVAFWGHHGAYGDPRRFTYPLNGGPTADTVYLRRSWTNGWPAWPVPIRLPRAGEVHETEFGGGVSGAIPITLVRATPLTSLDDSLVLRTPPAPQSTEWLRSTDRATRLAAVLLMWTFVDRFFPYFEDVEVDWDQALLDALEQAATSEGNAHFRDVLDGIMGRLQDGHASVALPRIADYHAEVGLSLVEGRVLVAEVPPDAAAAGVREGDEVLSIDGRPVSLLLDSGLPNAATDRLRRKMSAAAVTAGAPYSTATLELTKGADRRTVHLRRTARGWNYRHAPASAWPGAIHEVRPGIFYVDLASTDVDGVLEALPALRAARGIVFDVRSYPRGVATRVLRMLHDGPDPEPWLNPISNPGGGISVATRPDRHTDVRYAWQPLRPPVRADTLLPANVVFLTGPFAVSYGETIMGAVAARRLGPIIGEPTAGTNGDNALQPPLPGQYMWSFTGLRVVNPDGSRFHGVGIHPTIPMRATIEGFRDGRDELLERAIEILTQSERAEGDA